MSAHCVRRQARSWLGFVGALVLVAGCVSIPADPNDSLQQARDMQVTVGLAHNPPWVDVAGDHPSGSEVDLLEDYARHLDTQVDWVIDSESVLVGQLVDGELDIVIGGFDEATPWSSEVAMTRPYATDADGTGRVLLSEPGENALLVDLETFLLEREREGR